MTTTITVIETTQTEILQFLILAIGGGLIVGVIVAVWSLLFGYKG